MADSTVNGLPLAALPIAADDKIVITRDGVNLNQTSISNLTDSASALVQPIIEQSQINAESAALSAASALQSKMEAQFAAELATSEHVNILSLGVVQGGTVDQAPAINAAFESTAAAKQTLFFPDGEYYCNSQLLIPTDLKVVFSDNAVILRAYIAPNGGTEFIKTAYPTIKTGNVITSGLAENVHWNGGTIRGFSREQFLETGNVFAGVYKDSLIENVKIDYFGAIKTGRAFTGVYYNCLVRNIVIKNPRKEFGSGGVRIGGGLNSIFENIDCESGDDCFQFLVANFQPLAVGNQSNLDIIGCSFVNCRGRSFAAKLMIAAVDDRDFDAVRTLTATVANCSFINVKGMSTFVGVLVRSNDSVRGMENIVFQDCVIEQDPLTTDQDRSGISIGTSNDAPLVGVEFNNCVIKNFSGNTVNIAAKKTILLPAARTTYSRLAGSNTLTVTYTLDHGLTVGQKVGLSFETGEISTSENGVYEVVSVPTTSTFTVNTTETFAASGSLDVTDTNASVVPTNIRFVGSVIDSPKKNESTRIVYTINVPDGSQVKFDRCEIVCDETRVNPVIVGGFSATPISIPNDVVFQSCAIKNIGATGFGLSLLNSSSAKVIGCHFYPTLAQTTITPKAVQINARAKKVQLVSNNFTHRSRIGSFTGSFTQSGTLVSITLPGHGLLSEDSVFLDFSNDVPDGVYVVSVTEPNKFTVVSVATGSFAGTVDAFKSTMNAIPVETLAPMTEVISTANFGYNTPNQIGVNNTASGTSSFIGAGENNTASGVRSAVLAGLNNQATGINSFSGSGSNNLASNSNAGVLAGSSGQATGVAAVVGGGNSNIAGNTNSGVVSGVSNNVTGAQSFIGAGSTNTVAGTNANVVGGSTNTAAANTSSIGGGTNNTATGISSTIPGGGFATTNNIQGQFAYGFGSAVLGASQMAITGVRRTTATANTVPATANGGAAAVTNQLTLRDNTAYRVRGFVVARNPANGDTKEWQFTALIKRGTGAATVAFVPDQVGATSVITSTFADSGATTWAIALAADTTNGAFQINVTGQAATTINWMGAITSEEVA